MELEELHKLKPATFFYGSQEPQKGFVPFGYTRMRIRPLWIGLSAVGCRVLSRRLFGEKFPPNVPNSPQEKISHTL